MMDPNVAACKDMWTVTMTDPDGASQEMTIGPTLMVRRQPDDRWLVVIDLRWEAPFRPPFNNFELMFGCAPSGIIARSRSALPRPGRVA